MEVQSMRRDNLLSIDVSERLLESNVWSILALITPRHRAIFLTRCKKRQPKAMEMTRDKVLLTLIKP